MRSATKAKCLLILATVKAHHLVHAPLPLQTAGTQQAGYVNTPTKGFHACDVSHQHPRWAIRKQRTT
jgi:hypothetical protein